MNGRFLGVDYGTRRIGLAVSDETAMLATPLASVEIQAMDDAVDAIAEQADRLAVKCIVVGMPLNMNVSRGPSAESAALLARRVRERTGREVIEWDERLTTRLAEKALIASGVRRQKRRRVIDQAAAQLILQSYLDSRTPFS